MVLILIQQCENKVSFNSKFKNYGAIFSLSVLLASISTAYADTKDIEKISVHTQKQAYRGNAPLAQLPQSYEIIEADQLSDMGIANFQTALGLSSSIARQNNFGGLWESFAIRGFSGDENLPSAYLINGFSAGRGFSGLRDTSNIQFIEILKGPGSALYGRGEPGGTINIVTKKPQFEQQGYVSAELGSDEHTRFEGDFTSALSNQVAFRINGAYEDSGSFRDTVESEKLALAPSLLYKITEQTSITYELEYVDQAIPFDRGIPVLAGIDIDHSTFYGEPNDGPMDVAALGHQFTLDHQLNQDWTLSFGAGYRTSSLEGYSTEIELSPGRQLLYVDGETVSRQRRYRDYDASDMSFRVELSGHVNALNIEHNILVGADTYDYELDSLQNRWRVGWGSGDTSYSINAYNPVYGQAASELAPSQDRTEEQTAWGIYFQDQLTLSENLKALVGLRYDKFEQDITNHFNSDVASQSQSEFNPRLGLTYQLAEPVMFYVNYAEGFRPNSGADVNGAAFEPEKSESFEFGARWQSNDDTVVASFALFSTEKSNILTSDPVNSGFSMALGEAQSSGVEFDLTATLLENTELLVNYAYTDAHTNNDMINPDWGVDIPSGSRLINVPEHTANISLQHFTAVANYDLKLGMHVQYVGERLGETIDPTYELDGYTLTNLFGKVAVNDKVSFNASIENIFDESYIANSYSALWNMPGKPLTYTASIQYSF